MHSTLVGENCTDLTYELSKLKIRVTRGNTEQVYLPQIVKFRNNTIPHKKCINMSGLDKNLNFIIITTLKKPFTDW